MIQRCTNPKNRWYKNYGGRGITVCKEWRYSFSQFLEDVGLRPSPELSLDRIHNDRNYELGNVRWATSLEQNNNQRRSGIRKCSNCNKSGHDIRTCIELK